MKKQFPIFCLDKTFPKGTLIVETGKLLVAAGYEVRAFNTIT